MLLQALALLAFAPFAFSRAETPVYLDPKAHYEERAQDALARLTLDEKIGLVSGDETGFATRAIPRLGIPSIQMTDGPLGARADVPTTAYPSGIALAATWDTHVLRAAAKSMAHEANALGKDMLLGPCIDIARHPFGGRNFESFGEDPHLTSMLTRAYLEGIQAEGLLPSTKHFAMNDQEHKRMTINVIAEERAMQEIHLRAFQEAVNAGTWSIMASYNKLNGFWATENHDLLTRILKRQFGFKGFVVSDWGAVHSTVESANAGLDLEMPVTDFWGEKLLAAVNEGKVSLSILDDKVLRIFRALFASGRFEAQKVPRPGMEVIGGKDSLDIARTAAEGGIVLLKNEGNILPFDSSRVKKIAVIGAGAVSPRIGGGGSSMVNPTRRPSPLDELKARMPGTEISWAVGVRLDGDMDVISPELWTVAPGSREHGLNAEYFRNKELAGAPALTRVDASIDFNWGMNPPAPGFGQENFSVRWTGWLTPKETREYRFSTRADDGVRLFLDGQPLIDEWHDQGPTVHTARARLEAGHAYQVRLEYYQAAGGATAQLGFSGDNAKDLRDAVALAASADLALVFAGTSENYEGEGGDRASMDMPESQNELIAAIAAANPNTVVVINAGNPVTMPWLQSVRGLFYAWFPGQEGAPALAGLLIGAANPSGKLPVTLYERWEDSPAFGHYPEDPGAPDQVTYAEGLFVGYRWFDSKTSVAPLFPFGFGLSYTTFRYSNLFLQLVNNGAAEPQVLVGFDVANTGTRAGSEVAQIYVRERSPAVERPFQELKAFRKVKLAPGEKRHLSFLLDKRAFAYYSVERAGWEVNPGAFELRIGGSSRDPAIVTGVELK